MIDVVMPQMGESIVEGTLTRWLKKPGDKVERDEPLFEISTDKVDTEIPSPTAGVLSEVLVQEGATVAINSVVARIGEGDGAGTSATGPQQEPSKPNVKPAPATKPDVDVGPSATVPQERTSIPATTPTPSATSAGPYPDQPPPEPLSSRAPAQ
jgi:pyruvate dehydrogenase E2 component (dihydrolipoamide acetyltransferase)